MDPSVSSRFISFPYIFLYLKPFSYIFPYISVNSHRFLHALNNPEGSPLPKKPGPPGIPPAIQEFPHSGKYPLELPITYDKHTSHSQDLTLIYSSFNHSIYHRQLSSLPIRITTISYNTYIMLFLIFV